MIRGPSAWTDARKVLLATLWDEGYSAEAISRAIGGISRSSVLGKVRRMGLVREVEETPPEPPRVWKRHNDGSRPAPIFAFETPPNEPDAIGPIRDFPTGQVCKFIHGDVSGDWRCCGAPAASYARPWCKHHAARVYQRTPVLGRPRKAVAPIVEPEAVAA